MNKAFLPYEISYESTTKNWYPVSVHILHKNMALIYPCLVLSHFLGQR